jgi:hypothetical protein
MIGSGSALFAPPCGANWLGLGECLGTRSARLFWGEEIRYAGIKHLSG